MYSRSSEPVRFERDCAAVLVPQGDQVTLPAGTVGYITQSLGGSWTVFVEGNLMRIAGNDADAIGKQPPESIELPEGASDEDVEAMVWRQLRTCFDPEIPVNIVELGLVYSAEVGTREDGTRWRSWKPGCSSAARACQRTGLRDTVHGFVTIGTAAQRHFWRLRAARILGAPQHLLSTGAHSGAAWRVAANRGMALERHCLRFHARLCRNVMGA